MQLVDFYYFLCHTISMRCSKEAAYTRKSESKELDFNDRLDHFSSAVTRVTIKRITRINVTLTTARCMNTGRDQSKSCSLFDIQNLLACDHQRNVFHNSSIIGHCYACLIELPSRISRGFFSCCFDVTSMTGGFFFQRSGVLMGISYRKC